MELRVVLFSAVAARRLSYGVNAFYIDGKDLIMRVPVDGRQ